MKTLSVQTDMSLELILLFVQGQPVIYELEREHDLFVFTPVTSWTDKTEAESFSLQKVDGEWKVTGAFDKNIIEQAIEEAESRLT